MGWLGCFLNINYDRQPKIYRLGLILKLVHWDRNQWWHKQGNMSFKFTPARYESDETSIF